jgi:hypothetical protein
VKLVWRQGGGERRQGECKLVGVLRPEECKFVGVLHPGGRMNKRLMGAVKVSMNSSGVLRE